jgi:broad specificity phosphatase PhoE
MIIGLVRHFKVDLAHDRYMTSDEYEKWTRDYDTAGVIENPLDVGGISWDMCYSSDLPRAVRTAQTIYKGEISETPLLREVPLSVPFKASFRMHHVLWGLFSRIAWLMSHKSQEEKKHDTEKRIGDFLNSLDWKKDSNILVVCHGFFMYFFMKELIKRGFKGKITRNIKNGTLYVFKKDKK